MMHMTFYWGRQVTILFDSWKTNTWLSYFLSLFFIFLFCIFYQYLEDIRVRFKQPTSNSNSARPTYTTPLLASKVSGSTTPKIAGAVLFGVNSAIGYLLMLAVMSYNGGVLVAIVLGLAVGYFLFRSSDQDDVAVDAPCGCA